LLQALSSSVRRNFGRTSLFGSVPSTISALTALKQLYVAYRPPIVWAEMWDAYACSVGVWRGPAFVRKPACELRAHRHTRFVSCLRFSAFASCGCVIRVLTGNAFTGTIPAGISALTNLDDLYALAPIPHRRRSTRCFHACVSPAFVSCGCVTRSLTNNAFTGTVPAGIAELTMLYNLYALALMPHRRRSTCGWPAVFMLAFLRHFVSCGCVIRMLTNNAFTGIVPAGISTLTNLDTLYALAATPHRRCLACLPFAVEQCTRWEPLQRQRAFGYLHTDPAQLLVNHPTVLPRAAPSTSRLSATTPRSPRLRASPPLLPSRLGLNLRD
jgi:hypothetical protein